MNQVYFPNHRWFPLGLQLGLLSPTLEDIKANNNDNVKGCLQKCLTLWLNKADKVNENGGPTWDSLADALQKIGETFTAKKMMEFSMKLNNDNILGQFTFIFFFSYRILYSSLSNATETYRQALFINSSYGNCSDVIHRKSDF